MITVIGSPEELNTALHAVSPAYPEQHLNNIRSRECYYVLDGVLTRVILTKEQEEPA